MQLLMQPLQPIAAHASSSAEAFHTSFMPHGSCYLWLPRLVSLHVLSDLLIAVAYFTIPIILVYFVSQRADVPFNGVFFLFGSFIISCGAGHLMDIWTLWYPHYWAAGVLKAFTALISVYTAIQLVGLLPAALKIPSTAQLEAKNVELAEAITQLQSAQARLIHQEKMSSLGQLVAGIAHEINNPVNFIRGNLTHAICYTKDLLNVIYYYQKEHTRPSPALLELVNQTELPFLQQDFFNLLNSMQIGIERIQAIVAGLRTFSRIDEAQMKLAKLHEGIDSTLMILQHQFNKVGAIDLVKSYTPTLPEVECYPGQLNQVFMNLIVNAVDAIESRKKAEPQIGGKITIATNYREVEGVVEISITDNGIGVPAVILDKIFDPFFTTKPVGRGTGMGLAISHQIITERHRGCLYCKHELAGGSQFVVIIPIKQTINAGWLIASASSTQQH